MKTGPRTRLAAALMSLSLVGASFPVTTSAALVGTERALAASQQSARADQVAAFLDREEVARELARYGVAPEQARARVAALSEEELARLATEIDALPAGAGVLEVVGIVFVVLLILELVGVTNIFTSP